MASLPCVLVVLAIFIAAPAAAAHDDLAPPGAPHAWLPQEPWILEHWMPFDRGRLERALGLRQSQLEAYLFNDHHTLAELARRRGVDIDALADRLWFPIGATDAQRLFGVSETNLDSLRKHGLPALGHRRPPRRGGGGSPRRPRCRSA